MVRRLELKRQSKGLRMKPAKEEMRDRLRNMPEFREGAREFIQTIKECPLCSVKLALELIDSDDTEDKIVLKELLKGLGETLLERERPKAPFNIINEKQFPFLSGWLKGEIGLGIIAKLFQGGKND